MTPLRRLRHLAACYTLLLTLSSFRCADAFAQDSPVPDNASVSVTVSDITGAVIPNAEVRFQGKEKFATNTAQDGSVQVVLPYGTYVVTITHRGFKTVKMTGFDVHVPKPPVVSIVLDIGHYCDDCCDDCVPAVPTTTSDLPNVIEEPSSPDFNLPIDGGFTFLPPTLYMRSFEACSGNKPCTRTEKFRVDLVPKGCCVLFVTNGDGRGKDGVQNYKVLLNGKQVLLFGDRHSQVPIKLRQKNTLKIVFLGEPSSKIFIGIAYDPRVPN